MARSLNKDELEPNPSLHWLREHLGFLTDEHQINVGLTRARKGLCIIGMRDICHVPSFITKQFLGKFRHTQVKWTRVSGSVKSLNEVKRSAELTSALSCNAHQFSAVLKNYNEFIF